MTEIFSQVGEEFRERVKFIFQMALKQKSLPDGIKVLANFINACDGEEKEFALLAFTSMIEEYKE